VSSRNSAVVRIFPKSNRSLRNQCQHERARGWVTLAIAAGCDPQMVQKPLFSREDAGEWNLMVRNCDDGPGVLPDILWDAAFLILAAMGRIRHAADAMPWHGQALPDDSSTRAIAFRLKMVRLAMNLSLETFYRPCGLSLKTARDWEASRRSFDCLNPRELAPLCAAHRIPEVWLLYGEADAIELRQSAGEARCV
jgi:hypothetical protein